MIHLDNHETEKYIIHILMRQRNISYMHGLAQKLLAASYTHQWDQIIQLLQDKNRDETDLFLLKYVFQATVYVIWRNKTSVNMEKVQRHPINSFKWWTRLFAIGSPPSVTKANTGGLAKWVTTRQLYKAQVLISFD